MYSCIPSLFFGRGLRSLACKCPTTGSPLRSRTRRTIERGEGRIEGSILRVHLSRSKRTNDYNIIIKEIEILELEERKEIKIKISLALTLRKNRCSSFNPRGIPSPRRSNVHATRLRTEVGFLPPCHRSINLSRGKVLTRHSSGAQPIFRGST